MQRALKKGNGLPRAVDKVDGFPSSDKAEEYVTLDRKNHIHIQPPLSEALLDLEEYQPRDRISTAKQQPWHPVQHNTSS